VSVERTTGHRTVIRMQSRSPCLVSNNTQCACVVLRMDPITLRQYGNTGIAKTISLITRTMIVVNNWTAKWT